MTIYRACQPALNGVRFNGRNVREVADLIGADWDDRGELLELLMIEFQHDEEQEVSIGDYVIQIADDIAVIPGEIFELIYEGLDLEDIPDEPLRDNTDPMMWAKAFEARFPYSGLDAATVVRWFSDYAATLERATR